MTASARGLFRAMGKTPRPTVQMQMDGTYAREPGGLHRETDDFYPTPPEPTRAFLSAEINRLREFGGVWEPAAGDGAMVREMLAVDLMVYASDIIDRGAGAEIQSFYDYGSAPLPAIVTNPPGRNHPSHARPRRRSAARAIRIGARMIPSNDLLRPDNQEEGYVAMRERLGFALAPRPRMRLDLVRPHLRPAPPPVMVVSKVEAVVVQPAAPPPLYGAPFNFLKPPSWRAIVKLVALKHAVPPDVILGHIRSRQIVAARQEAMHAVFRHCTMSLPEIGRHFNKDHTTVLHAIRVIEGRLKSRARKC